MSTTISFRFPGGRYHATPWDQLANEAGIEWPPSPWRIIRALVATWHRKIDKSMHDERSLENIVLALAQARPLYRLPPIVQSHTRHYMPSAGGAKRLVFDGFARIDASERMVVSWPGVVVNDSERVLLAELVQSLGYLGRAESWVEGEVLDEYNGSFNCLPAGEESNTDDLEEVRLFVPRQPAEYLEWRQRMIEELGLNSRRLGKRQKQDLTMMPAQFIDALRVETNDIRGGGWPSPPGAESLVYRRPAATVASAAKANRSTQDSIATVRFLLSGKPLPRIEHALRIGEAMRHAAMHWYDKRNQGAVAPSALSGHDLDPSDVHAHAFYLPEDADGDGFIDHVLVHAPGGLPAGAVRALAWGKRLWINSDGVWRVVMEGCWTSAEESGSAYGQRSTRWVSATPYLHPWFARRGYTVIDQIRRECDLRELRPVEVRQLDSISIHGRELRPIHFHRFRTKGGSSQPDRRGSFWQLTFDEPVSGPIAFGFGCHFGLGIFAPA